METIVITKDIILSCFLKEYPFFDYQDNKSFSGLFKRIIGIILTK
jgi:hypothetical protein